MTSSCSKHKLKIWLCETCLPISCFERCQLNITWVPIIKDLRFNPPLQISKGKALVTRLLQNDISHWFIWMSVWRYGQTNRWTIKLQPKLFSLMGYQIFNGTTLVFGAQELRYNTMIISIPKLINSPAPRIFDTATCKGWNSSAWLRANLRQAFTSFLVARLTPYPTSETRRVCRQSICSSP